MGEERSLFGMFWVGAIAVGWEKAIANSSDYD
jgi:hypothetical protein